MSPTAATEASDRRIDIRFQAVAPLRRLRPAGRALGLHAAFEAEERDLVLHFNRIVTQRLTGRGYLFHQRGILLGDGIETDHGTVDFRQAGRLFIGGTRHLANDG